MVVDAAHNRGNMAVALLARDMVFHEMAARKQGFIEKQEPPSLGLHNGEVARGGRIVPRGMKTPHAHRPARTEPVKHGVRIRRAGKSNHNDLELGCRIGLEFQVAQAHGQHLGQAPRQRDDSQVGGFHTALGPSRMFSVFLPHPTDKRGRDSREPGPGARD